MPSPQTGTKTSKHDDLLQKALDLKFNRQFQDAEKVLKKIMKEYPKNEKALLAIAEIQADTKRFPAALNSLAKIIKLNPNHAKAWRHMGFIEFQVNGNLNQALDHFSRALQIDQTDPEVYYYMGLLSQNMNQYDDAAELLEIGLKLAPSHPEMISYLGVSYIRLRRFNEAEEHIIRAVKLKPQSATIFMNALRAHDHLKLSEESLKILDEIAAQHRDTKALRLHIETYDVQKLMKQEKYKEALDILEKNKEDQYELKHFHIGAILRKQGKEEEAFKHYKIANRIQAEHKISKKYKKSSLLGVLDREQKFLTKENVEKLKIQQHKHSINRPYKDPVFLCGFPRSGTTLLGTILDAHPDIISTDEYGAMDIARLHFQQKYRKQIPDCLVDTTREELQFLHDIYNTKQAGLPLQHKDKIFVDKMPLHNLNMCLAHAVFPDIKILFVRRHPLDSILSGFMQAFSVNAAMIHFNDIEDMARLYKKMHDTWELQKKMLPIQYHEYKYEDLVDNFEEEATKILDFIGAGWNKSVEDFYKEDKSAEGPRTLTPSRTQVNKGLYKTAQNRWKKYEEHLKPAIDILGDTIEKMGYEV